MHAGYLPILDPDRNMPLVIEADFSPTPYRWRCTPLFMLAFSIGVRMSAVLPHEDMRIAEPPADGKPRAVDGRGLVLMPAADPHGVDEGRTVHR